jgi:hypothetical protein
MTEIEFAMRIDRIESAVKSLILSMDALNRDGDGRSINLSEANRGHLQNAANIMGVPLASAT